MAAGVTVIPRPPLGVDVTVELAADAVLLPGVQLHGETSVAAGAEIGPDSTLTDTLVGPGAKVIRAHCMGARIGERVSVGPFAYLRPGTVLDTAAKIGTFVEVKGSQVGAGSKVPHLSYVGDATIGEQSNIGAASVFVNYDGVHKHRTVVGSHCRMGSDNMYVAPVTIGDGAYSGPGRTVILGDVPAGALAIPGAKPRVIEGWVERKRPGTAAAEAAARAAAEQNQGE